MSAEGDASGPRPIAADGVPPTGSASRRRVVPMTGRDPREEHRTSTPLELLFDLTFVVAISLLATELAHSIEAGHLADGYVKFLLIFFAIWVAWLNFTWFASAYDVDDVPFRLLTLLQIGGVLFLAAGVPAAFELQDFKNIVIGYLVMRVALVLQWLRAAHDDKEGRGTALRYAVGIVVVQAGWTARLAVRNWHPVAVFVVLGLAELALPLWAERKRMTRWHPHHISERYALFTIIVLGECVLASSNALKAGVSSQGLTFDVILVGAAGLVLLFSLWWLYFLGDAGDTLQQRPELAFVWGYGHVVVFGAIAALGAGLEVAALGLTDLEIEPSNRTLALTIAAPTALYLVILWCVHDRLHGLSVLTATSVGVAAAATLGVAFIGSAASLPVRMWLLTLPSVALLGWQLTRSLIVRRWSRA